MPQSIDRRKFLQACAAQPVIGQFVGVRHERPWRIDVVGPKGHIWAAGARILEPIPRERFRGRLARRRRLGRSSIDGVPTVIPTTPLAVVQSCRTRVVVDR